MQSARVSTSFTSQSILAGNPVRAAANCPHPCPPERRADHNFVMMLDAYRGSGGLARAEELLALFRRNGGPDVTRLARWIVERKIICFEWQSQTWLPLFQFNRVDLVPDPQLNPVFEELQPVYDHWEMATWFARPNPWLAHRIPVETLGTDFPAVLGAARADRFVAS